MRATRPFSIVESPTEAESITEPPSVTLRIGGRRIKSGSRSIRKLRQVAERFYQETNRKNRETSVITVPARQTATAKAPAL